MSFPDALYHFEFVLFHSTKPIPITVFHFLRQIPFSPNRMHFQSSIRQSPNHSSIQADLAEPSVSFQFQSQFKLHFLTPTFLIIHRAEEISTFTSIYLQFIVMYLPSISTFSQGVYVFLQKNAFHVNILSIQPLVAPNCLRFSQIRRSVRKKIETEIVSFAFPPQFFLKICYLMPKSLRDASSFHHLRKALSKKLFFLMNRPPSLRILFSNRRQPARFAGRLPGRVDFSTFFLDFSLTS